MPASRGDTIRKAISLKTDEDVVERLRQGLPDALEMLDRIACGDVPRNAAAILKGIELQLRFSQPLPKQVVDVAGTVGFQIVNPWALAPGDEDAALPARPEVRALPPTIRRNGEIIEGQVLPSPRVSAEPEKETQR